MPLIPSVAKRAHAAAGDDRDARDLARKAAMAAAAQESRRKGAELRRMQRELESRKPVGALVRLLTKVAKRHVAAVFAACVLFADHVSGAMHAEYHTRGLTQPLGAGVPVPHYASARVSASVRALLA